MGNDERRITCRQTRCLENTLCQSLHWQVRTCWRIRKSLALRLSMADCSDTAHDINKTIIAISFLLPEQNGAQYSSHHSEYPRILRHTARLLGQPQTLRVHQKHLGPVWPLTQSHALPIPPPQKLTDPQWIGRSHYPHHKNSHYRFGARRG